MALSLARSFFRLGRNHAAPATLVAQSDHIAAPNDERGSDALSGEQSESPSLVTSGSHIEHSVPDVQDKCRRESSLHGQDEQGASMTSVVQSEGQGVTLPSTKNELQDHPTRVSEDPTALAEDREPADSPESRKRSWSEFEYVYLGRLVLDGVIH